MRQARGKFIVGLDGDEVDTAWAWEKLKRIMGLTVQDDEALRPKPLTVWQLAMALGLLLEYERRKAGLSWLGGLALADEHYMSAMAVSTGWLVAGSVDRTVCWEASAGASLLLSSGRHFSTFGEMAASHVVVAAWDAGGLTRRATGSVQEPCTTSTHESSLARRLPVCQVRC